MESLFLKFFDLWKENYKVFIMDRIQYIDSNEKKHIFAYFYPLPIKKEIEEKEKKSTNGKIIFERKKIEIEEIKKMVSNLIKNKENKCIQYPDGEKYELGRMDFEERIMMRGGYKHYGKFSPSFRFIVKENHGSLFTEDTLTILSEIEYLNVAEAIKEFFDHQSYVFTEENYSNYICFPLVIDLSHFEWRIKEVISKKNKIEIEIEPMRDGKITKPTGILWVKYSGYKKEKIKIEFEKENKKIIELKEIPQQYDFFLMAQNEIGFGGERYRANSVGRVLDSYSYTIYVSSEVHENFIDLNKLEKNDIVKYIEEGENEKVEFKSVESIKEEKDFYLKVGKQLVGMANLIGGGIVIFGVSDNGLIEGVGDLSVSEVNDRLQATLNQNCRPFITFQSKKFELEQNGNKKSIIVISVIAQTINLPYSYMYKKNQREFPIRTKGVTKWMSPEEIKEYCKKLYTEEEKKRW